MRAVRGYEEKDPEILRQLTSGYPRFVVHPFARQLAEHFASGLEPSRKNHTLWLTSSARVAGELADHLAPTPGVALICRDGVNGVSHPLAPETYSRAKLFLQNTGGFISSREAEDRLIALGLKVSRHPEKVFPGNATAEIQRQLFPVLPGTTTNDLFITNSGMNAIYASFRAVSAIQATRGRTIWLQLGWLYLDTIAILKKFTRSPEDYLYHRDVFDLAGLRQIFAKHGSRIAGVVAEVPTNPLIQTTDLPALAGLCRQHGARLIVDPSVAGLHNLDVLPHADLVVTSLTKYTASEGDLTAGLVAVNPAGPDAAALRTPLAASLEPLYPRDAARLAHEIAQTETVLAKINASTPHVAEFLSRHPAVREVYWSLQPGSRENYLRLARGQGATGGMITFTLREPGSLARFYDRLRLPKGPSFGMKNTLICPFMYLAHYDLVTTPTGLSELAASNLDPDLLRLCVGTEPIDEIVAALAEALS
jgi:cystathionine gamma-synthase